jgi:hypothetical protein
MNTLQIGCVAGLLLLEGVERKKNLVERCDGGLILHYHIVSR